MLDEVFSNLDNDTITQIKEYILKLSTWQLVVLVDHLGIIDEACFDMIININHGKIHKIINKFEKSLK